MHERRGRLGEGARRGARCVDVGGPRRPGRVPTLACLCDVDVGRSGDSLGRPTLTPCSSGTAAPGSERRVVDGNGGRVGRRADRGWRIARGSRPRVADRARNVDHATRGATRSTLCAQGRLNVDRAPARPGRSTLTAHRSRSPTQPGLTFSLPHRRARRAPRPRKHRPGSERRAVDGNGGRVGRRVGARVADRARNVDHATRAPESAATSEGRPARPTVPTLTCLHEVNVGTPAHGSRFRRLRHRRSARPPGGEPATDPLPTRPPSTFSPPERRAGAARARGTAAPAAARRAPRSPPAARAATARSPRGPA